MNSQHTPVFGKAPLNYKDYYLLAHAKDKKNYPMKYGRPDLSLTFGETKISHKIK